MEELPISSIYYTVFVFDRELWISRGTHKWQLGNLDKFGVLQFQNAKNRQLFDDTDIQKIEGVLSEEKTEVGSLECLFQVAAGRVVVSMSGQEQGSWTVRHGLRLLRTAPPVLRKDADTLAATAAEMVIGSGIFATTEEAANILISPKALP